MKTKLLTICLLLVTLQVSAGEITRFTSSIITGTGYNYGHDYEVFYITYATENFTNKNVTCWLWRKDKVVAKNSGFISGVGVIKIIMEPPCPECNNAGCR